MDTKDIDRILASSRTIAIVGLSPKPDRPSYRVASYLKAHGYRIIPVHPTADTILDEPVYRHLQAIDEPIDVVDVFRKAEDTPPIAEAAVAAGAKVLWLQLGIENPEAERIARAAGLSVVQNRCMKIEHERWVSQNGAES
jgi:predicted CoA-binding protein